MNEKVSLNSLNDTLERRIHLYQEKILTLERHVRELGNRLNHKN